MRASFILSFVLFAVSALAAPVAVPEPIEAVEVDARGPPGGNAWCGNRMCSAYKE